MSDIEPGRNESVERAVTWIASTVGLFTLAALFWAAHWTFWVFAGVAYLASMVLIGDFLFRRLTRKSFRDIGPSGTAEVDILGRVRSVAPLAIAEPKTERATKVELVVPTVAELLKEGMLGTNDLLLGYTMNGQPQWGSWSDVRTFAIAGKGRSGKTVTMFFLCIQAILSGGVVWVADPHFKKKSSITALLKPLAQCVRFAGTGPEISDLVNDFIDLMESRVDGSSRDETPILLVVDEYTRLAEENERAQDAVVACAQQYAGFGGYAMIAGHEWTGNGRKLVKMRRALHAKFVHRLDEGYAKFLLNSKKHAALAEKLRTGNNFFQDTEGEIHELRTPLGTVEDAATIARQFLQITGPESKPGIELYPMEPLLLREGETADFRNGDTPGETPDFRNTGKILSLPPAPETKDFNSYQGRKQEVARMLALPSVTQREIIFRIWGARPGESQAYKDALAEYKRIREEILVGA